MANKKVETHSRKKVLESQSGESAGLIGASPDPAATKALEALKAGKWRKARDIAKELCKRNRGQYLPLLIEANAGLARDLIARGLASDAKTVIDYLKTIAPEAVTQPLEQLLTVPPSTDEPAGAPSGTLVSFLWPELLRQVETMEAGQDAPDAFALADDIVAAFSPDLPVSDSPLAIRVATELEAIHSACAASSEGRWEEATLALRKIPARSVFRHWRVFLRGMRHFFHGEEAEAGACFSRLPKGSTTALASAVITGDADAQQVRPAARASWMASTSGAPVEWGAAISEAESAWREGNWNRAWEALTRVGGSAQLASDTGLAAALAEGMFSIGESDAGPFSYNLLKSASKFIQQKVRSRKGMQTGIPRLLKALILSDWQEMEPSNLRSEWSEVLLQENVLKGADPLRDGQGWLWLGRRLLDLTNQNMDPFGFHEGDETFQLALEAFVRATKSDPDNEPAWLGQLEVHERTNARSARNRLLDQLVDRFPDNKAILVRAGSLAVERKAFTKALKFFDRVLQIDPLDRSARQSVVHILCERANDAAAKGKPHEALWERIESLADPSPHSTDLAMARWVLLLKRSLIDPDRSDGLLAEARAAAPSELEFLAFEQLLRAARALPLRKEWSAEWSAADVSWTAVCGIFGFGRVLGDLGDRKWHANSFDFSELCKSLGIAAEARGLFDANPSEALGAVQVLIDIEEFVENREIFLDSPSANFLTILLEKSPGSDLHSRFLHCLAQWSNNEFTNQKKLRKSVHQISVDAAASGLSALAESALRLEDEMCDDQMPDWDSDPDFDRDPNRIIDKVLRDFRRRQTKRKVRPSKKKPASKPESPVEPESPQQESCPF